ISASSSSSATVVRGARQRLCTELRTTGAEHVSRAIEMASDDQRVALAVEGLAEVERCTSHCWATAGLADATLKPLDASAGETPDCSTADTAEGTFRAGLERGDLALLTACLIERDAMRATELLLEELASGNEPWVALREALEGAEPSAQEGPDEAMRIRLSR
ncbi:MAG: hypothetical protein ACOCUS_04265, partial [Polyangiales bacterium]